MSPITESIALGATPVPVAAPPEVALEEVTKRIRAVIDVEHRALRAFEQNGLPTRPAPGSAGPPCRTRRARFSPPPAAYSVYILSASSGSELKSACAIMFFSRTAFSMCFFSSCRSSRSATRKPAAAHLVFVGRTDAARGGADLHPAGRVLRRQFDHAMVGQDHVSAIGDEKISVDLHASLAQRAYFFQKRHGIENHAVADHAAAARPQHAARNQLQNKLLAVDDDGVAGIVAAGIAGHDGEVLRQNVDDLSFAFVAPLGADNYRGLAFFHCQLRHRDSQTHHCAAHTYENRGLHTPCRGKNSRTDWE